MSNYKEQYKEELSKNSNEELKEKYKALKDDLLYMEECIRNNSISSEQRSEFINSDIPTTKASIKFIEEVLKTRKIK